MNLTRRALLRDGLAALGFLALPGGFMFAVPKNLPKGWKLSVSPNGVCRIVKSCFVINVK